MSHVRRAASRAPGGALTATLLVLGALALGEGSRAEDAAARDAYIAGYALAVLERELALPRARVHVDGGALRVEVDWLSGRERERIADALREVDGVTGVEIVEGGTPTRDNSDGAPGRPPPVAAREIESDGPVFLPPRELFAPLLADPRWPHFAATYQGHIQDEELDNVGAVSFGESLALLAGDAPVSGRWELGVQGSVFSVFDLDAESFDLVNSDFLGAVTASYRLRDFSALARILHQSSHLGDEFILRSRVERVNLSFEELDVLLSYDLGDALRVYGGGGYLLRRDPSDLDRGSLQVGLELVSPRSFVGDHLRPLAALDVQWREESDWGPDYSARGGVQLESSRMLDSRLQILLEYYEGRNPNGQFFERDVQYLGVGTHLHF